MEDLLKLKEEEITKLNKVKDALRGQVIKLKKENNEMKEQIETLKQSSNNEPSTSYPDLELKLKNAENQVKSLTKEKKDLKFELKKIRVKAKLPGSNIDLDSDDEEDEVQKMLEQVKNGMFKLGQQNFTIDNKIDSLLEKIESLATSGIAMNASAASMSGGPGPSAASQYKPMGKKPLSSQKEYISPGLAPTPTEEEDNKAEEEPEPEFRRRRPSDILKAREGANKEKEEKKKAELDAETDHVVKPSGLKTPKVSFGVKDSAKKTPISDEDTPQEGPEEEPAPKPKSPVKLFHGIKTVPYPEDGVILCPSCEAQNFQEMQNKAKIISFTPVKKYGKKYYCKKCRSEWDYSY
jgi:hypothetical protein